MALLPENVEDCHKVIGGLERRYLEQCVRAADAEIRLEAAVEALNGCESALEARVAEIELLEARIYENDPQNTPQDCAERALPRGGPRPVVTSLEGRLDRNGADNV